MISAFNCQHFKKNGSLAYNLYNSIYFLRKAILRRVRYIFTTKFRQFVAMTDFTENYSSIHKISVKDIALIEMAK